MMIKKEEEKKQWYSSMALNRGHQIVRKKIWLLLLALLIVFVIVFSSLWGVLKETRDKEFIAEATIVIEQYRVVSEDNFADISIEYPQIFGLADVEVQDDLNIRLCPPHFEGDDDAENLTLETWILESSIVRNRVFSTAFHRWIYRHGTVRPYSSMWALNFDIKTGEYLQLTDIIKLDERFISMLLDGTFVSDRFTHAELLEIENTEGLTEKKLDFYLTGSSLVVVAAIPYIAGGYVTLSAFYTDIEDILCDDYRFLATQYR